jgi:hypothetical protein
MSSPEERVDVQRADRRDRRVGDLRQEHRDVRGLARDEAPLGEHGEQHVLSAARRIRIAPEDHRTAESVVLRASQLCRQHYASWEEFSCGYALGRVLRFDNGEYGHMYESVLGPHLMLVRNPLSPWRNSRLGHPTAVAQLEEAPRSDRGCCRFDPCRRYPPLV